jgi:hypothetical protein
MDNIKKAQQTARAADPDDTSKVMPYGRHRPDAHLARK